MRKCLCLSLILMWILLLCPVAQAQYPSYVPNIGSLRNYGQPAPSYGQPAPSYGQPAPSYGQPAPSYGQPAPSYGQSAPSYGQPAPSYGQPAPSYGQSAPSYGQSAPSYGQSAPSYGQSAPNYGNYVPGYGQNVPYYDGTPSSGVGSVSGEVVDSYDRPLNGASVRLECGMSTTTGFGGTFQFSTVPDGVQSIRISKDGYKTCSGSVNVVAGQNRTLKVSLSRQAGSTSNGGSSATAKERHGNFEVVGNALHVGPRERRMWVYKISVYDTDNSSHNWKNTWFDDVGQSEYTLRCDDAIVGHRYRIKITWRMHGRGKREISNDWDVEFTNSGQTFRYDHPNG